MSDDQDLLWHIYGAICTHVQVLHICIHVEYSIIYALEIIQCAHQRGAPALFIKLDFAKAFDMVNWASLQRIMSVRGFPP
jgi:hypothetical protein